ncbi:amidase [Corticibacter populi]|uniref:Amidase n=1 Tax=Corticibacter populi TaxID=1550736 RepID=A0A3M6QP74_9BURK|nr:acetamidase/formamidase family protein [Corticibacter populi]RMX04815.1 amidase [Corticibacter populi]RZS33767.1 acetamidase/formamidase [Corticibacter populi]
MTHHYLPASPQTVCWGAWDAARPAVLRVRPGDTVTIDTLSGEPADLPADERLILAEHRGVLAGTDKRLGPHLLTGPIWVEGAEPGDALEVHLLSIELRQSWGWNLVKPGRGTLPDDFPVGRLMHIPLDAARGVAQMPFGSDVPLRPFFGNFGVAPAPELGAVNSMIPMAHGGNMDNRDLVAGTCVRFPVFNPGALFSAGDGHAAQGHGEVCLTAIETSLRGTFRFELIKHAQLCMPRAESPTHLISMGLNEDLDEAARQALREMIAWLGADYGMAPLDAYSLCSVAGDLHVTQTVDINKGVHCALPRQVLPRVARPLHG